MDLMSLAMTLIVVGVLLWQIINYIPIGPTCGIHVLRQLTVTSASVRHQLAVIAGIPYVVHEIDLVRF